MAKDVAEARGWPYRNHEQFLQVVNGAAHLLQGRLHPWRKSATDLHIFYYWRKEAMDADDIRENLADVEALIGALEGLLGKLARSKWESRLAEDPTTGLDVDAATLLVEERAA